MTREALLASLAEAVAQRRLRPLDLALARFLAECDAAAPPVLLLLAALLSRQLADGHLCLDLRALDTLADQHDWPAPWRALLAQPPAPSPLLADACGLPTEAPLVLDGHRLYLRRYWNHERAVAQGIRTRLALPPRPAASLRDELDRLFPSTADGGLAWPRIACALAARGAFAVITGGPGTGKTTTVVRLLGLLQTLQQREDRPLLRIRLAAPTGKAAARLNASIAAQRARLELDTAVREAIPAQVDTLHRLLGARTDDRGFRHGPDHPLHLDVLVIDEASMVDLELMAAVLAALPPTAKLILLGDKDQLASVEAGAVLGDLCQRADAGHYDDATVAWLSQAGCGDVRAWASDDARPLDQQVAMLRQSHRFDAESGIGRLAAAVNAGDAAAAMALLESDRDDLGWLAAPASPAQLAAMAVDGRFRPAGTAPSPQAPSGYRRYLEQLRRTRPGDHDGDAAFAAWAQRVLLAFGDFQLLCALRHAGAQSPDRRRPASGGAGRRRPGLVRGPPGHGDPQRLPAGPDERRRRHRPAPPLARRGHAALRGLPRCGRRYGRAFRPAFAPGRRGHRLRDDRAQIARLGVRPCRAGAARRAQRRAHPRAALHRGDPRAPPVQPGRYPRQPGARGGTAHLAALGPGAAAAGITHAVGLTKRSGRPTSTCWCRCRRCR